MANENEMKIVFGADTSALKADTADAAEVVKKFGDQAAKAGKTASQSFDQLKKAVGGIGGAFDEVAAGSAAMARISKSIDEAAAAAIQGGKGFEELGSKLPLQDMAKLRGIIQNLKKEISIGLGTSAKFTLIPPNTPAIINNTAVATGKLKKESNAAANSLIDVSRVLQDLPYGLVGIGNNLNPLLESFGRLKKETGSAGGAFKALAGSIGGVGGIGLAISVATSAFLIFQNGISGFNRKTKEAQDTFRDFVSSLRDSKSISDDAVGSVDAEILKVKSLVGAIQDVNRSNTERKRAIEELKGVSKAYFGDLTLEGDSLRTLTSITDEYTKSLINQAKAKGFADEISKITPELYKQEGVLTKLKGQYKALGVVSDENVKQAVRFGAAYQEVQKIADKGVAEAAFIKQRDLVDELNGRLAALTGEYDALTKAGLKFKTDPPKPSGEDRQLTSLKKQLEGYKKELEIVNALRKEGILPKFREDDATKLEMDVLKLLQRIDEREVEIKLKPKLEIDPQLQKIEEDEIYSNEYKRLQYTKLQLPVNFLFNTKETISKAQKELQDSLKEFGFKPVLTPAEAINGLIPDGFETGLVNRFKDAGFEAGKALKDYIKHGYKGFEKDIKTNVTDAIKFQLKFEELQTNFSDQLKSMVVGALAGVGEIIGQTIGSALSGADFNPGQAIIELLASSLAEIGKATIAYGVQMALLKKTLSLGLTNPYAIIGIGIGIVALGSLLKGSIKPTAFAEGGLVMGPTLGLVGEAGPELIIPLNRAGQFLDSGGSGAIGEFTLRGQDLLLSYERTRKSKKRRGG